MAKRLRCYRAFWPNGDVSFSFAQTLGGCKEMLDEEADPENAQIEEIDCPEGMTFHLSCQPLPDAPPGKRGNCENWHTDAYSESVFEHMPPEAICRLRVQESLVFWRAVRIVRHRFGGQRHSEECQEVIDRLRALSDDRYQAREERLRALVALGAHWSELDPSQDW